MRFKYLGNTKEKIPEIGIGTWKMGPNPDDDVKALHAAIDNGMKFIDTAEMYGTEWIVSDALKGRKDVFVATKVSPHHFRHKDVIHACDASLANLRVRQIDLYQLHWPNHSIPIKETMGAMEELVDSGKIRHIGVSNFTVEEFEKAQESMKKYDIVSNQVEYSVLVRDEVENGLYEFCNRNKVTLIAYSPLARGLLFNPKNSDLLGLLEYIGKAHRKTAAQVALNWLVSKGNTVAIPKAGSVRHVIENAGASGWNLSKKELELIDMREERNSSITGPMAPILKRSGIWSKAAHVVYKKGGSSHSKSKTTKSSKK